MNFSITPLDWSQTIFVAFVGIISFAGGMIAMWTKSFGKEEKDDREE